MVGIKCVWLACDVCGWRVVCRCREVVKGHLRCMVCVCMGGVVRWHVVCGMRWFVCIRVRFEWDMSSG